MRGADHLFVRHHLTPGEHRTLRRISRGLPQLRALRGVVEEIHRLFDRRCRTETALTKLDRLRAHVRRFKGLRPIFQKLQSSQLGEGADLPGRSSAGFDLQRRGTGQPPASQDAEDGVPGSDSIDDQWPDHAGQVSRRPRPLPRTNAEDTPPRQVTMIPGGGAKDSTSRRSPTPRPARGSPTPRPRPPSWPAGWIGPSASASPTPRSCGSTGGSWRCGARSRPCGIPSRGASRPSP